VHHGLTHVPELGSQSLVTFHDIASAHCLLYVQQQLPIIVLRYVSSHSTPLASLCNFCEDKMKSLSR
jgi:hypothetical protein